MKVFTTAITILKEQGAQGLAARCMLSLDWRTHRVRQKVRKDYACFLNWFFYRNWVAGKIVEILGNKGRIRGLTFCLANPYIATFLKSRFLFHTYEGGAEELLSNHLNPALPVVEFGACIGVISCLTNRVLNNPRHHVVVEAQPHLIPTLAKNRDQNNCHFDIINAALAYGSDTVNFWINPSYFIGNSIKERSGGQTISVRTTSLKKIVDDYGYDKLTLIVDVEGAETDLVNNELELMSKVVETLIIELHPADWGAGRDAIETLRDDLALAGFEEVSRVKTDYIYINKNI